MHIEAMRLEIFMAERGLDDEKMAALVGADGSAVTCDRSTISRIRRRKTRPSWDLIACFKRISDGQVTADDFLEARASEAAE